MFLDVLVLDVLEVPQRRASDQINLGNTAVNIAILVTEFVSLAKTLKRPTGKEFGFLEHKPILFM
jgi:hypothetical protein